MSLVPGRAHSWRMSTCGETVRPVTSPAMEGQRAVLEITPIRRPVFQPVLQQAQARSECLKARVLCRHEVAFAMPSDFVLGPRVGGIQSHNRTRNPGRRNRKQTQWRPICAGACP